MRARLRACPVAWIACISVGLLCAPMPAGAGPYVRKATARATWEASLAAKADGGVRLGAWHYVGPFAAAAKSFGAAHVPVSGVDLSAGFRGKGGRFVGWKKAVGFVDGKTNDLRIFGDNDNMAVYLYRSIVAASAARLKVGLGSDDGIVVWLNGRRILSHRVTRACRLGDERVALDLAAGANELVIKIVNGSGPTGFAFAPASASDRRGLLLEQIAKDFPPEQVHELAVELDWLRWDRLTGPGADFRAAAARALKLAEATLKAVGARTECDKSARELHALKAQHAQADDKADWQGFYLRARRLRRRVALSDPLGGFDRLLLVKRAPPGYNHMCDQYLGRHSRGGGGLFVIDRWKTAPVARALLAGRLSAGTVTQPDLSFDARRVLLAFCDHTEKSRAKRRFHVWEAAVDGSWLRQLTGVAGDPMTTTGGRKTVLVEDFDPCYLPDGGFAFISTRNQGFGRCHGGRYTPSYVLYRAELPPPGAGAAARNIRRISFGEANEWAPSVLHDGRIVYCRWDYINRHDTLFQSLWVTRPDGAATALIYGNNTRNPCMTSQPRAVPGSHKIVCTAAAHHAYSAGSILLIDPALGSEGAAALRRITPDVGFPETEGYPASAFATPWPLSDDVYLASYSFAPLRSQGRGNQATNAYGIYLVDAVGGRELIYRDPEVSCFSPIPLRPRPRPPVLPSVARADRKTGVFFVQDVYRGTRGIPRGSVKHLRVVRMIEQPTARAAVRSAVANEVVKGVVGVVPVGPEGSTAFRAPARQPLLFQLLDENYMAVMSMRSQTYLQGGERASCVGCHEGRNTAPPVAGLSAATIHDIAPPPGPRYAGGLSFARTVQPVLDRHCIRCHGLGKAKPSLLGEPAGRFSVAYESLTAKRGLVRLAHRNSERPYSTAKLYGSHAGRLARLLLEGHEKVALDRDGFRRIAAWLDLNGQYYGDYSFQRVERRRPDRNAVAGLRRQLRASCASCHKPMPDQPLAALVNVAAPAESRVLQAGLAKSAGGWEQCRKKWADARAPGYRKLLAKVLAVAGRSEAADVPVTSR